MPFLPTILLILAAVSVGAMVIAAVISMRSAREARTTLFPIVREEESIRAGRARIAAFILVAFTALFLGGWLATLRLTHTGGYRFPLGLTEALPVKTNTPTAPVEAVTQPEEIPAQAGEPVVNPPTDLPAATAAPTFTPILVAAEVELTFTPAPLLPTLPAPEQTATPNPTLPPTQTFTPTPAPTATPTPTSPPTATPTPTVFMVRVPASPSRTPAPAEVRMGPIQFATKITPDVEAVDPSRVFPASTKSIYAVYPFRGMTNGIDFSAVWYHNGVELLRDESKWEWGRRARSYSFLNTKGPGLYKLELYVNDSVVATSLFEIR